MARVPVIGRLYVREYFAVLFGFVFIATEALLRVAIFFLPKSVIHWFHDQSRSLFHRFVAPAPKTEEQIRADQIRRAQDFGELCHIFGYAFEEHVVQTGDGYLLGLHRLPSKQGQNRPRPGSSTGKPVVYLHHGLLMNSDIWLCATSASRCLPLVLVDAGFDVWLGNNRGNKYSKKSIHHKPNSTKFWDYSIDDFAWHDIPDSINYILTATKETSLSYVGFSQGTAQAFAALSIHPQLNEKIDVFIALAPAMRPPGLSAPVVDGLMKASPTLMYLFFGRKAILSSTVMWQSILYPPIFAKVIDSALSFLFGWTGENISTVQKIAAYAHLYSFSSTKAVVHWFQIMRTATFLMYDDDVQPPFVHRGKWYSPAKFPTRNIATPIVLLYGTRDSLVDIDVMLRELPQHTVAKPLPGYEHVDILWGRDIAQDVFPEVLRALKTHASHTTQPARLTTPLLNSE
ncbi:triacylglycerol lipase [Rickenella mellea]|uniref:Triacylglycerol lipase n=1 Tax=Rickenella mellea TaxID=50990 RepID=A0A4Y7Q842_9AGAM|nr:triacylglycerol lipase [Rickenella mellea]